MWFHQIQSGLPASRRSRPSSLQTWATCRLILFLLFCNGANSGTCQTSTDFVRYARQLRIAALSRITPNLVLSVSQQIYPARPTFSSSSRAIYPVRPILITSNPLLDDRLTVHFVRRNRYPWKLKIVSTVFWIGERAAVNNPVSNDRSCWDANWLADYGGYDSPNPNARRNFVPIRFVPRQNPFYIALPYNDVSGSHTRPEAAQVIPWFGDTFVADGQSVLRDRWVVIRHGAKVCFAQWEDCGPFRTDHWQYVFGDARPKPNRNHDAGLDVSPAVRDYLGLADTDVCDWRFCESSEIPPGPWKIYAQDNAPLSAQRRSNDRLANRTAVLSE